MTPVKASKSAGCNTHWRCVASGAAAAGRMAQGAEPMGRPGRPGRARGCACVRGRVCIVVIVVVIVIVVIVAIVG